MSDSTSSKSRNMCARQPCKLSWQSTCPHRPAEGCKTNDLGPLRLAGRLPLHAFGRVPYPRRLRH
eukprot:11222636-Lingulodinium_polyedra.AAC.1